MQERGVTETIADGWGGIYGGLQARKLAIDGQRGEQIGAGVAGFVGGGSSDIDVQGVNVVGAGRVGVAQVRRKTGDDAILPGA